MIKEIEVKYWKAIRDIVATVPGMDSAVKLEGLKIECQAISEGDEWYSDKADCGKYRLVAGTYTIATWELYQMKNCCGICVSTAATVREDFKKKGLGKLLNQVRIDYAKIMGYGLLLCTDVLKNKPQQKILDANGWEMVYSFKNPRTKNDVGIHVVPLK